MSKSNIEIEYVENLMQAGDRREGYQLSARIDGRVGVRLDSIHKNSKRMKKDIIQEAVSYYIRARDTLGVADDEHFSDARNVEATAQLDYIIRSLEHLITDGFEKGDNRPKADFLQSDDGSLKNLLVELLQECRELREAIVRKARVLQQADTTRLTKFADKFLDSAAAAAGKGTAALTIGSIAYFLLDYAGEGSLLDKVKSFNK